MILFSFFFGLVACYLCLPSKFSLPSGSGFPEVRASLVRQFESSYRRHTLGVGMSYRAGLTHVWYLHSTRVLEAVGSTQWRVHLVSPIKRRLGALAYVYFSRVVCAGHFTELEAPGGGVG